MEVRPPSDLADGIPAKLDALVLRNLSRAPNDRQDTARQFALSLEDIAVATASQVGGWVQHVAGEALSRRSEIVAELERDASGHSDVTLLREAGGAPTEREGSSDEHGTRSTLERERGPETDVVTTSAGLGAAPVVDGDTVDTLVHARSTPISAPSDVADERSEAEGTKRLVLSPREGSATVAEPPRRERRGVWAAAMVLAALLGALGVILLRRGGEPTTDRGGDPGLGPLQTASASASRSESASGSASASAAASAPASGSASATVSAPALPMGSGWRSPGVAQPAPRASVAATAVPAAKPCDPPFTVDERGIRRLKPECM
jgi:serine/threonine-protein kinase